MIQINSASEIVGMYGKSLSEGNIPEAFSYFSEQVLWHQPGKNKFSGLRSNIGEVGQMLAGMMQDCEGTLKVIPTSALMENGNLVSMPVRFSAKKGNLEVDMIGTDLFEVIDGKITQVWLFSENQGEEDNFWGN